MQPENIFIEDLREDFVRDYVFPMFRANAVYEGVYLLGTSIARPLIAKRQIEIAEMVGADAVCHGATGKGNDQVRFELGYYALKPDIRVIAPWRDWEFKSRTDLHRICRKAWHSRAGRQAGRGAVQRRCQPLAHLQRGQGAGRSRRGGARFRLPAHESIPRTAPDKPEIVTIGFEKGDAVSVNGEALSPAPSWPSSTRWAAPMASAGSTSWKTVSSA